MAKLLKSWFDNPGHSCLELYIEWCYDLQDFINHIQIGDEIEPKKQLNCLYKIISIRDELAKLNKSCSESDQEEDEA
jgi:hypothetical protein